MIRSRIPGFMESSCTQAWTCQHRSYEFFPLCILNTPEILPCWPRMVGTRLQQCSLGIFLCQQQVQWLRVGFQQYTSSNYLQSKKKPAVHPNRSSLSTCDSAPNEEPVWISSPTMKPWRSVREDKWKLSEADKVAAQSRLADAWRGRGQGWLDTGEGWF